MYILFKKINKQCSEVWRSQLSQTAIGIIAQNNRLTTVTVTTVYTTENTYRTEIYMHAYCLNISHNCTANYLLTI